MPPYADLDEVVHQGSKRIYWKSTNRDMSNHANTAPDIKQT